MLKHYLWNIDIAVSLFVPFKLCIPLWEAHNSFCPLANHCPE